MPTFGELKNVELRNCWPNEACDFTPWLADNLDALSHALGLELELQDREADCGDFSLDILAKDLGTGRAVIIENQLTQTDHDHLGKLLTYAAGFDASVVVWLAERIRDEHRQTLDWLNQRTDENTDFFGVVIDVLQIDNSRPAVNFRPVAFPNEWQKGKGNKGRTPSSKGEAYKEYFQALIDELREKHKFTNARAGQPQSWYAFGSGVTRITYGTSFTGDGRVRAEVYVDLPEQASNKAVFSQMHADREKLEQEFGANFVWERLDDRRASRIAVYRPGSISLPSDQLDAIRAWAIENLLRFRQVFGGRLRSYVERAEQQLNPQASQLPFGADTL